MTVSRYRWTDTFIPTGALYNLTVIAAVILLTLYLAGRSPVST